ncbi:MAG: hypothetical protein LBN32_02965 [Helicobacteraceae bacterium]|jgi:hypothetical protein|nr:hypothetical protein [Helicobacteraceae bacterium]
MKYACVFCLFATLVIAAPTDKVLDLYHKQDYKNACLEGAKIVRDHKNDDLFVNAFGIACLESDFIDFAGMAGLYLRASSSSRQNASYILTVVLQKKLLYHALADNVDLSDTKLPDTPHILSRVFNAYVEGNYTKDAKGVMTITLDNNHIATLDSLREGGHFKVRIRQYEKGKMLNEHLYW